ncbi:Pkinase domain-containing protein [Rhizoctonia solani AG-1 IA]|uniref:Pkinase domain-containing protein n=1 Tax=Thanatephorus cucumeris (strain AG1-IA) TaxID=983506 RepID=L8X2W3_THACA|nr:Pkinase domain-containing protein [Rhizoctonia solani AG-1 IA]
MSTIYTSPLWSGALGATSDITKLVRVNRTGQDLYEEAGLGGSADIFSGKYIRHDGGMVKVYKIGCSRRNNDATTQMERLEKKLARELEIWRNLSGGSNIIELLGIMTGIGPLPSFVCELCPWNLQDTYEDDGRYTSWSQLHAWTRLRADCPRGYQIGERSLCCYMFTPCDDAFQSNILVNSDETALICDFGRSRQPNDRTGEVVLSGSSPFAGTVRYMSPELLFPASARPSPAADMWAYGCIALEILCRIHPYNEASSDVMVAELIKSGHLPSGRPTGPRGSLINDTLWSVLSSCWQAQDWRPTAQGFLEELNRMVHSGEVPSSPIAMDLFTAIDNQPIPPWARTVAGQPIVVKVPRLNASLDNQTRHDHLEIVFRKVASSCYDVHHPNIIDFLGITSGFSPHEGLVFEACYRWTLAEVRNRTEIVVLEEYTRSTDPYPTAHSLMCDILEGLKYMHGYPIPITHGDLRPENISIDDSGRAKISLMSFGRMLAALPPDAAVTGTIESVLSFRWMSPELIISNRPQQTTESDMWTFGCVCFWLLTLLEPYSSIDRDDLAGAEIIHGHSPATLSQVYRRDSWTTNGLWNTIAKCWRQSPLQRPSATDFMKILTQLEGRKIDWLPISVIDLAGKVRFDSSARQDSKQVAHHLSIWRRFDHAKPEILEEVRVKMTFFEATYSPKWYSKATRTGFGPESSANALEALYSVILHELESGKRVVALMEQIDHPFIHRLLGIDSSLTHTHIPDMIFEPLPRITLESLLNQGEADYVRSIQILRDVASAILYLHEHRGGSIAHGDIQPSNIYILSDGRAKLANLTCGFQYISGQPASSSVQQWSEAVSTPPQPSLYSSPESRAPFAFPTIAGDVWSFGMVILSTCSPRFRGVDIEQYMDHTASGTPPLELQEAIADCDDRVLPLLRELLVLEPTSRLAMSLVLPRLSQSSSLSDP